MFRLLLKIILFPFRILKIFLKVWILVAIVFGLVFLLKPLPEGFSFEGEYRMVNPEDIRFFADRTYTDEAGNRVVEQEIFDEVFHMIAEAKEYILVDMFLYNQYQGWQKEDTRGLAYELTSSLVAKKTSNPEIEIAVITDPINSIYGAIPSPQLLTLKDAGIVVVETNLHALPDSNPLYSGFYRSGLRFIPDSLLSNALPNPFSPEAPNVSLSAYTRLLNFKANHRKVVIADDGRGGSAVLVTSANPHDGSSAHSNVAVRVNNVLTNDVMQSERAVARISNVEIPEYSEVVSTTNVGPQVRLVTEEVIDDSLVAEIKSLKEGDTFDMVMFYFSKGSVISALKDASERGVKIRLLLDPNKDAFGREKNGVPNRPVAHILTKHDSDITVRWCDTNGEQCHSKMILIEKNNKSYLSLGSANITRRNIGGFNLETNIEIVGDSDVGVFQSASEYFDDAWNNTGGTYSTEYATYADDSLWKRVQYYVMEYIGTSSF
ncbi:MAG: phospholipase D-like domain-containing protein [Candidatus Paceibacterota bacterium]